MDINMPIMDGYEATARIRQFLGKQKTTIVAVSAYPPSEVEVRATESGMDMTMTKPITAPKVTQILERAGIAHSSP